MEQQTSTLTKLQVLETIYQQGYQNELVDLTLEKILDLEREQAHRDMNDLHRELSRFEAHYHLTSEDFYQRFQQGELGDDGDYFEWSACYDMYTTARERLHALTGEPA